MRSVQDIAKEIVAREGGYVNDPADPGGPTKYGVTLATMKRLGIDLTGDGNVTDADVRKLTAARAVAIFEEHYYQRPGIAALPVAVQASVFDMHVNAGAAAIRLLQQLVTAMGFLAAADGIVGAETAAAAAAAAAAAPDHFTDAYGIERRNYYYALADARPASRRFARRADGGKGGWIVRAEEFISSRYHLSAAAHAARVAAWA